MLNFLILLIIINSGIVFMGLKAIIGLSIGLLFLIHHLYTSFNL